MRDAAASGWSGLDAAAAQEEVEQQDDEDEVKPAAAVVAPARAGVESAATDEKNQDDEQNDHVGWMLAVRSGVIPCCVRAGERKASQSLRLRLHAGLRQRGAHPCAKGAAIGGGSQHPVPSRRTKFCTAYSVYRILRPVTERYTVMISLSSCVTGYVRYRSRFKYLCFYCGTSSRGIIVKIDQDLYRQLAISLLTAVERSDTPIGMPDALEVVTHTGRAIDTELAVAIIWQMLASDQLRFTEARKLEMGQSARPMVMQTR